MYRNMEETGQNNVRPLSLIKAGERVKLISIAGGQQLQSRMQALGLLPGTSMEMLKNRSDGPVIIIVKGSRLVLGRGMSQDIMVC